MNVLRQCLIIDPMHNSIFEMLRNMGWEGVDMSEKRLDVIKPIINNYEGLFVRTRTRVDENLLGSKPTLKFVARAGAGLDNVDVDFLTQHGVQLVHASEGNRDAVGEYTIGALLALLRNITVADSEVRKTIWLREENRGVELGNKVVGIIGYGNMGQAFAKRLSGFGCRVLAYDKYKTNFTDAFAEEVTLAQLQAQVDILSLHLPLTPETFNMVDEVFFKKFAKQILLLNTARGELISLRVLVEALRTKTISGAVLDVLENEKLTKLTTAQQQDFDYLCAQRNVLLTPHIAGWTFESHLKINQVLIEKLKALGF
jgi:D-3-phosphoglycerate dehydrogenase / 2-oxoglutarate reductase